MTKPNIDVLFRPFKLKSLELKNRIVMAPMTRTFSPNGVPGDNVAAYYRRRAEGEVGLILSEGTVIDRPGARNHPNIPFFHGEAALKGWQKVIDEVHAAGGKMGPQIWHVGSVKAPGTEWEPQSGIESPSGLVAPDVSRGQAMSEEDIADTIAAYAQAAADTVRLGFDTLEIHAAHGYLIDQFFWGKTNLRTDEYGGATLKQRSRFAAEVIKGMRQAVGPDFPILLRVSQWKQQDYSVRLANTPLELADWLTPLVDAGVDILHCSQRRFWEAEFPEVDGENGLNFAGWAKKVTGAATISVGSVGLSDEFMTAFSGKSSTPAQLDNLLTRMARDEFDLIAIGRALITDPNWVVKVRQHDTEHLQGFEPASLGELV
ncbi:NADH:flavin oxidoreductase [Pectobacteriaceae bacterium CE90]|nr:NADH:flavin oxidoreductase [Pectobacteriaceae bacterium CE90]